MDDRTRSVSRGPKRAADLIVGALVALPALVVVGLSWVLVVVEDGRPGFFRQTRVGLGGREFGILKLRTMRRNEAPVSEVGQVGSDHPMVTRVGRWLRRLKVDELPQVLNVLAGDMSLVGPRPTVAEQVREYDDFARRRLAVRPGVTGWAQVNGNVALTWEDRIRLDVWYVDHWRPALDLRILARTIGVLFRGERVGTTALNEARAHEDRTRRRG
ncbi:MAG: sugar transferase [Gemmatimonadales bacterium]